MQRLSIFILSLALSIIIPHSSQHSPTLTATSSGYRLHTPSLDEYVNTITNIVTSSGTSVEAISWDLANVIEGEFLDRYETTASAAQLSSFYEPLIYGQTRHYYYTPYFAPQEWNLRIVKRWLAANPVDLATTTQLLFDVYQIDVSPVDFNHDGETEWLLYVRRDGDHEFSDHWIARSAPEKPEKYDLITLPVPFHASDFWPAQPEWTFTLLEQIKDVNNDGNDEFIFSGSISIPDSYLYDKLYYLVGWQTGSFQLLTAFQDKTTTGESTIRRTHLGTRAQFPEWKFENIDSDRALELIQVEGNEDNWQCQYTKTTLYDWNGTYYLQRSSRDVFKPTVNCALRQAEVAMAAGEYTTAITYYELAWSRYQMLEQPAEKLISQWASYAQERTVIAYLFAGREAEALTLIDQLRLPYPTPNTIAFALIQAVDAGHTDIYQLCEAAYHALGDDLTYKKYRGLPAIGYTSDELYGILVVANGSAAKAGCDLLQLQLQKLLSAHFITPLSPLEQLQDLGFGSDVTSSIHSDLNQDGLEDWLIRINFDLPRLLFISQDQAYVVSTTYNWFSDALTLPDNGRSFLLSRSEYRGDYIFTYPDGHIENQVDNWEIKLWKWKQDHLEHILTINFPFSVDVSDIFDKDGTIHTWARNLYKIRNNPNWLDPVSYVWNSSEEIFEMVTPGEETNSPALTTTSIPDYKLQDLHSAVFYNRDYEQALVISEMMFSYAFKESYPIIHYYRALALEKLNRPDEALAEYIAIYEAAPDSAWGMLAALHLEKIQ